MTNLRGEGSWKINVRQVMKTDERRKDGEIIPYTGIIYTDL